MITVLTCGSSKSAHFCSEDSNFDLLHIGSCKRDETRLRPQHAARRNQHTFMQKTLISTCYSKSANFSSNNKLRQLLVEISTFQFEWLWVRLVAYRNQWTPVQIVDEESLYFCSEDSDFTVLLFGSCRHLETQLCVWRVARWNQHTYFRNILASTCCVSQLKIFYVVDTLVSMLLFRILWIRRVTCEKLPKSRNTIVPLTCASLKSAQLTSKYSDFDLLHLGSCNRDKTWLRLQDATVVERSTMHKKSNFDSLLIEISKLLSSW